MLVVLSVVHNLTPIGLVRLSGGSARVMLLPFLLPLALLALPALSYWGPEQWAPMEVDWLGRHLPLALPGLLPALVLAQCLHYLAVLRILPDGPWLMSDRDCRWADQEYLQRENGTCAGEPIVFDRFCSGMSENLPCSLELTVNGVSTSLAGHCLQSKEVLEGKEGQHFRSKSRNVVLCQPDHPVPHDIQRSKPPNP